METYTLPHFPSPYSTIHIALFRSVSNAPSIRRRLIDASLMLGPEGDLARAEIDFTFLEARLVRTVRIHLAFLPSSLAPLVRFAIGADSVHARSYRAITSSLLSKRPSSPPSPLPRPNLRRDHTTSTLNSSSPSRRITTSRTRYDDTACLMGRTLWWSCE